MLKYIKVFFIFVLLISFGQSIEVESNIVQDHTTLDHINNNKTYFGEQLFQGHFTNKSQFRENPNYILKIGDIINISIWGALDFQGDVTIDGRGNIFVPKIGVMSLAGTKNSDLQTKLETYLQKRFNDNVFIYANVRDYQALSVYLSGSVKNVGLYDGVSNDSILQFIDKAGGIIPGEGSYRHIQILRNNQVIKNIDLYAFLLDGYQSDFRFKNNDTILIQPIQSYVEVEGDVSRPFIFELKHKTDTVQHIIKYALPKPGVNRFTHIKRRGMKEISKTYSMRYANRVFVKNGEKLIFNTNSHLQSYTIEIEGEHAGLNHLSVPKGTSLYTVLKTIKPTALSDIRSTQLFRKSIAKKQKSLLDTSLKDLESRLFTSGSATPEEATIRNQESKLVMQFIARAKQVKFKGQVIFTPTEDLRQTLVEDGDKIYIPKKSNLVTLQGEINIPNTLTYKKGKSLSYYLDACGGLTERADPNNVLLIKANGTVTNSHKGHVEAGDSILVLGKTDTKNLLLAKDLTQILYQVAVGAAVVLQAF